MPPRFRTCVPLRQREDGDPILRALAVAYGDDTALEVDVLYAEAQRFENPKSAAVEETCDQEVLAVQLRQDKANFTSGEHERKALGPIGPSHILKPGQGRIHDVFVEKEYCGQCLRLCCRGNVPFGREVRQE